MLLVDMFSQLHYLTYNFRYKSLKSYKIDKIVDFTQQFSWSIFTHYWY